jgi:malate dehydrogenase (oxaloacetate-decarboxylating)
MDEIKVVVNGVGAAGVACSKIRDGSRREEHRWLRSDRSSVRRPTEHMNWVKDWYAQNTNPDKEKGTVHDVIKGADVFFRIECTRRDHPR